MMKKYFILLSTLFWNLSMNAQGIHLTQYNEFKSVFNPSYSGIEPNVDYRAAVAYRNQWNNVPVPYNTYLVNGDFSFYPKAVEDRGWIGVGLAGSNDQAGNGELTNTRFQLSFAYHQRIGEKQTLSAGLSYGMNNLSLNPSKLTYANQWDGGSFNPVLANGENFAFTNINYGFFNGGLSYTYSSDKIFFRIGYGMLNINRPFPSFLGNYTRIGLRHIVNLEGIYQVSERIILKPYVIYNMHANASELLIGAGMYYNVSRNLRTKEDARSFISGINYRHLDAFSPYLGYEENTWKIVLSYDLTTSKLSEYNGSNGAFEICLVLNGPYPGGIRNSNYIVCPRF